MNLSHGYGTRSSDEEASRLLNEAIDLGYSHLDTAALYGFGHNEQLIGRTISHRRSEYTLASKCVLVKGEDGKRAIDGRPERIKATCEQALKNLQKGAKVVTNAGIHGTVVGVDEDTVTLKVDDKTNTRIRFSKAAVWQVLDGSSGGDTGSDSAS